MGIDMKAFMKPELKDRGTMEFPGIERYKDAKGNVIPFIIKRLSMKEIKEIRNNYKTKEVYRDKRNGDRPIIGNNGQVAGSSMEEASSKAINLSGALKTLFAVVSAAAIIGQVKDFAADSIELGKNYTSVMSEVAAISGASSSDLAMMEDTARQYGATTVFSASEAAEALKYMSLAGWDAQQSTDALGGVLNLAAASSMGLGEASDMVTDYLSAFGMQSLPLKKGEE